MIRSSSGFALDAIRLSSLVGKIGSSIYFKKKRRAYRIKGTALDERSEFFLELFVGQKRYALSNHLGNVLAVVNDRKNENVTGTTVNFSEPTIISANDYYPFGLQMDQRSFTLGGAKGHRYGFNGKEKDTDGEWGSNTHYDFGARIYNPAIAKFLSVDPLTKSYPAFAPYNFAANTPIMAIDKDGENFIIVTWHSKVMDQGHAAIAIANTHVIIENGVEKLVHDGTFSVYEVFPYSGGGDVTDYLNDVSATFEGLVSKKPEVYTVDQLLNLHHGHGEGRAVSGAVEFISSAKDDRINAEILNSMITEVGQIDVPINDYGHTERRDIVTNNNISYSIIDSEDNCTFSCASFVSKSASLLYGIDLGKPENIKTRAKKDVAIDRDGNKADIPALNVNAYTPNSVFQNGAFKGNVLKGKNNKANNQNFIDQVTGGQLKDETPNN